MRGNIFIEGTHVANGDVTILPGEEKFERVVTISPRQTIMIPRGKDPDIVLLKNIEPMIDIRLGCVVNLVLEDGTQREVIFSNRNNRELSGQSID